MDLALNNLQWLIYRETKPNQTKPNGTPDAGHITRFSIYFKEKKNS